MTKSCSRLLALLLVLAPAVHASEGELGATLPVWTLLPFVGTLLAIALLPLFAAHFWEKNKNKAIVAALFKIATAPERIAERRNTARNVCLAGGGVWVQVGRDEICQRRDIASRKP